MWFHLSPRIRRWFLNLVVEVNDARVLRFLEVRFKANDLGPVEAWQALLLAFNHLQALPELVEMAKVSSPHRTQDHNDSRLSHGSTSTQSGGGFTAPLRPRGPSLRPLQGPDVRLPKIVTLQQGL